MSDDNILPPTVLPDSSLTIPQDEALIALRERTKTENKFQYMRVKMKNAQYRILYGEDDDIVEPGSLWAFEAASIATGWKWWGEMGSGEGPLTELAKLDATPVSATKHKPFKDSKGKEIPPRQIATVNLRGLEGEDRGMVCVFEASNRVGINEIIKTFAWYQKCVGQTHWNDAIAIVRISPETKENTKGPASPYIKFEHVGVYTREDAIEILATGVIDGFEPMAALAHH